MNPLVKEIILNSLISSRVSYHLTNLKLPAE